VNAVGHAQGRKDVVADVFTRVDGLICQVRNGKANFFFLGIPSNKHEWTRINTNPFRVPPSAKTLSSKHFMSICTTIHESFVLLRKFSGGATPCRSAGFQTCFIADFQVGGARVVVRPAGLETRPPSAVLRRTGDTADLEVCATLVAAAPHLSSFVVQLVLQITRRPCTAISPRAIAATHFGYNSCSVA
jgi:hypothetical protein